MPSVVMQVVASYVLYHTRIYTIATCMVATCMVATYHIWMEISQINYGLYWYIATSLLYNTVPINEIAI